MTSRLNLVILRKGLLNKFFELFLVFLSEFHSDGIHVLLLLPLDVFWFPENQLEFPELVGANNLVKVVISFLYISSLLGWILSSALITSAKIVLPDKSVYFGC